MREKHSHLFVGGALSGMRLEVPGRFARLPKSFAVRPPAPGPVEPIQVQEFEVENYRLHSLRTSDGPSRETILYWGQVDLSEFELVAQLFENFRPDKRTDRDQALAMEAKTLSWQLMRGNQRERRTAVLLQGLVEALRRRP